MKGRWPGSYSDAHRCEPITIVADGRVLTMELLGVTFSGSDFDDLAPSAPVDAGAGLILQHGALCSCVLTWEMPVSLHGTSPDTAGVLDCRLTLGAPAAHGGLEREDLELSLRWNDSRVATSTSHGLFETALAEIQRQLPAGTGLKACISCALSDYSPAGNGLFGTLACFRDNQAGIPAGPLQARHLRDLADAHRVRARNLPLPPLPAAWNPSGVPRRLPRSLTTSTKTRAQRPSRPLPDRAPPAPHPSSHA